MVHRVHLSERNVSLLLRITRLPYVSLDKYLMSIVKWASESDAIGQDSFAHITQYNKKEIYIKDTFVL